MGTKLALLECDAPHIGLSEPDSMLSTVQPHGQA